MKSKRYTIIGLIAAFVAVLTYAFWNEIAREEATLQSSISGIAELDPQLFATGQADVVRTDRLVLILVDPTTRQPVAMKSESPMVPPMTVRIGQDHVRGDIQLSGEYLVVGISDKDGEIFRITPGEVYGISPQPVALGSGSYKLVLDQPYRGGLFNKGGAPGAGPAQAQTQTPSGAPPAARGPMMGTAGPTDPKYSIAGTITVTKALAGSVAPSDRLIILMFDPEQAPPVAFKLIPHLLLPQKFTIGLPPDKLAGAKPAYNLRILTDKDNNPFGSAEGEVIGRSTEPIPLGSSGINFVLDRKYVR